MSVFDGFVGVPWRDRGRTLDGCDCYGLVRLVLATRGVQLAIEDGSYRDTADRAAVASLIAGARGAFVPIAPGAERPFDLVLIRERPWHLGIVAGAGRMLHVPADQSSCIEPYGSFRYGPRIEGFYRHEALA